MHDYEKLFGDDKLHEECGVVGLYTNKPELASQLLYYGLFALQHRGQESAGIAMSAGGGQIDQHKGMGLVAEIFNNENLSKLNGCVSIGHVRYSTTGSSQNENDQPIEAKYKKGAFALAHNGYLVNADACRELLEDSGVISQTSTDTQGVANMIARNENGS